MDQLIVQPVGEGRGDAPYARQGVQVQRLSVTARIQVLSQCSGKSPKEDAVACSK